RHGWCCGAKSPFGNGEWHPLALMVVASRCAFEGRSAALLADADDHGWMHAQSSLGQTHGGVACLRGQSPILARRKLPLPLPQRRVAVGPTGQTAPSIIPSGASSYQRV